MLDRYQNIRNRTVEICSFLETEDHVIQSMPEVSPPKWHLAHTTWFFERFLLEPRTGLKNDAYSFLFNSYYETVGDRVARHERGLMSRPTVNEIYSYRRKVDDVISAMVSDLNENESKIFELGLHHEEQHQELLLTDIKHIFWTNAFKPAYGRDLLNKLKTPVTFQWIENSAGMYDVGATNDQFAFDNEKPRHKTYLESFAIASRPVLNKEYIEFIEAGGYENPALWLSEGWSIVKNQNWRAPFYWKQSVTGWMNMTFSGMQPVIENEPVCHVSYFEADAYARWRGMRLPTEAEWEVACSQFAYGDVWEWTMSGYFPYPGYVAFQGVLAEYNGKFMCNQMVLRGGSRATSCNHSRATYRNFFSPETRWQFSGFRMARNANI